MEIPYLDLTKQYEVLSSKIDSRVKNVLAGGQYILGPEVAECEDKMSQFIGAPYCLTVASGTDALLMALLAYDVKPGDEVIVPAFSFFATAEVVALIGAIPVFVDVEVDTFNIDVKQVESLISKKTKAIMPVSLYGQVPDMDELNEVAMRFGVPVIEDAAQSFGAKYGDKKSCNLSQIGCTSFFPAKPLGCYGDGGAVFCQDKEMYDKLSQVRNHGQESRYYHTKIGYNGRLDTLQCAILIEKLERYPWEIEQRQKIAAIYDQEFRALPSLQIPLVKDGRDSVYAQYTIQVDDRDRFQTKLKDVGVPTSIHYPKGMHEQPALSQFAPSSPLKVTETVCDRVISLPLYADMPMEHVEYVVESVKKVLS